MDYPEFTIMKLRGADDPVPLPFLLEHLPGRWGQRMKYRWLMWRLPVGSGEVQCLQRLGEVLVLPFWEEDLNAYTKEEITDMLHRIIMEKGVQNMVVDRALEPFLEKSLPVDGNMIPLLMLKEILRYICRKHQISERELKPVVIASDYRDTSVVLGKLGTNLNRLTIVTEEPEAYEEYAQAMYEEHGLLVNIKARPLDSEVYGNLVLELCGKREKDYRFYRSGSIVLNLSGNPYRTIDACLRRKDLSCYNRFDIRAEGEIWDNRILQAVIYKTSTWMGAGQLEKGEKIKEFYGLEVEKAGVES